MTFHFTIPPDHFVSFPVAAASSSSSPSSQQQPHTPSTLFFEHYPYSSEDTGIKLFKGTAPHTFDTISSYEIPRTSHPSTTEETSDDESSDDTLKSLIQTPGVMIEFTGSHFKPSC